MNLKLSGLACLFIAAGGILGYELGLRSAVLEGNGNPNGEAVSDVSIGSKVKAFFKGDAESFPQSSAQPVVELSIEEILALPARDAYRSFNERLERMTAENVVEFLAAAEALPPGNKQNSILRQVFRKWGEVEKETAFEYARSMQGRSRMGYLSSAAEGWAKAEPEAAWQAVLEVSNYGALRSVSVHGVLASIAADDLELAARLAFETEDRSGSSIPRISSLISAAEKQGEYGKLLSLVSELAPSEDGAKYVERIFQSWGQYDYEGPSAAISTLQDSELAKSAMGGLMKGWASSDAAGAFRYALDNQSDDAISAAIPDILNTWINTATQDEIRSIPEQLAGLDNYELVVNRMVGQFAKADPQMAFDLANSLEGDQIRENSIRSVMGTWSYANLDEAAAFLPTIADSETRVRSASMMVSAYLKAKRSPEEVMRLVDVGESQKQREMLLSSIAAMSSSSHYGDEAKNLKEFLREDLSTREDISDQFRERTLKRLDQTENGSVRIYR